MALTAKQKRDSMELVLLSVLAEDRLYGYAIIKEVAARSEGEIRLTAGVLYPILHELERDGLILATWETVRSDRAGEGSPGRRRKWYRLSAKGRKRLQKRIEGHRAYQAMIEAFLPDRGMERGEAVR